MNKLRIVGVQITCDGTKKQMLQKARKYIVEALETNKNIDVIALPETFYQSLTNKIEGEELGEKPNGEYEIFFKELAKEFNINIIGGSYLVKEGNKSKNKCLVINREGEIVGEYSKIHLFDSFGMKESDYMEYGDHIGVFELDCAKVGVIICYDIRFPELSRNLALKGIDILFIPAAFYLPRLDQWELLIKSTAIHCVSHVCAINQFGKTKEPWVGFFGRSMLVDPYGCIVAGASDKETYFFGEVDLDYAKHMKETNPCLSHRRTQFY
jgi:predicted amidohydrolase